MLRAARWIVFAALIPHFYGCVPGCITPTEWVFVTEDGGTEVLVFESFSSGAYVGSFGAGLIGDAAGIALDPTTTPSTLYVADSGAPGFPTGIHVFEFDPATVPIPNHVSTFTSTAFGRVNDVAIRFSILAGGVFVSEKLYVADTDGTNGRVHVFDMNFNPQFLLQPFTDPVALAIEAPHPQIAIPSPNLHVVDRATALVSVFDPSETFVLSFGGPGAFTDPRDITALNGQLWITDHVGQFAGYWSLGPFAYQLFGTRPFSLFVGAPPTAITHSDQLYVFGILGAGEVLIGSDNPDITRLDPNQVLPAGRRITFGPPVLMKPPRSLQWVGSGQIP